MKKHEIISWILILIAVLAAGLFYIFGLRNMTISISMDGRLFVFIVTLIAIVFNILMLEVLHCLGAMAGGYSVSAVNYFGLSIQKKEKGIAIKIYDYDGLTGETKIAPKKEKLNLKHYVWFPIFGYIAELAGCIVLFNETSADSQLNWLGVAALIFILWSSILFILNIFPVRLDFMNDGYRLVLMSNPTNLEALNELLRVQDLQRNEKEIKDVKIFEDITEFTANLNLFMVYNLLKEDKFDEAEAILDKTLTNVEKLEPYTHYELVCQKLYIDLMSKDLTECRAVYDQLADDKARRYIANDNYIVSVRAYILISGLLEKSENEVEYAKAKKIKALKRLPKDRVDIEEKLYNKALDKVYEAHPKWNKEKVAE